MLQSAQGLSLCMQQAMPHRRQGNQQSGCGVHLQLGLSWVPAWHVHVRRTASQCFCLCIQQLQRTAAGVADDGGLYLRGQLALCWAFKVYMHTVVSFVQVTCWLL